MHELSVCNALVTQIERIAAEHAAGPVERIIVALGPLSGVEARLLRQAWPLAATGTIAGNAELVIETSEVVIRCTECDAESTVPPNRLLCGACGDFRTRLVSGDEMLLRRLEFAPAAAVENQNALMNSPLEG
ncbi:MAG: hydrogenase maturation nickel metallochaperone HypA [Gammaproteobacteria bacterium]